MVRYKTTENRVVLGGSTIPTTIMGSTERPYYSIDGSDFTGVPLALLSDIKTYTIATQTTDGLMSSTDKTKLDGLKNVEYEVDDTNLEITLTL